MSKQTSFSHQKKVLNYLSNKLEELVDTLNALSENHEKMLEDIYEEQGLMEEIYMDYKQVYLESTRKQLKELAEKITSEDIPFVEKEIDFFSSH